MDREYSFLKFPDRLESRSKLLPCLLLLAVTFALYGPALYFDFIWDDFDFIISNFRIHGFTPAHVRLMWTKAFILSPYAPIHHTLLAGLYSISGIKPFAYHLAQLLLHAACVCLLFLLLKEIESASIAFLATLWFAVFGPNIENVAWVSESKSTLAFLFFLLSFRSYIRLRARERWSDGILCGVFLVLSLLSKVSTIVAPAIFLLYDYKRGYPFKKGRAWSLAAFFLISLIFVVINLASASGNFAVASDMLSDATLASAGRPAVDYASRYIRFLNIPQLLFFYIGMAIYPHSLSAFHMVRIFDHLNWIVVATWAGMLALAWLLYRSPRDLQFWQLWFYIFLAPVMQIFPNTIWVADRYLYIPAIGVFVLLSKLVFYISDRLPKPQLRLAWQGVAAAVLLSLAWQTHSHLPVWQNELTFWSATTTTCTTSSFCHGKLGAALARYKQFDAAAAEFARAIQIRPKPQYFINLGDSIAETGDYRRSLRAYQIALEQRAGLPFNFWSKVAKTYYMAGDLEECRRIIEERHRQHDDDPNLALVNAFLQWREGHLEESRQSLEEVLALHAANPEVEGSSSANYVNYFWGHPAEVGRLLADLGPLDATPSSTQSQ